MNTATRAFSLHLRTHLRLDEVMKNGKTNGLAALVEADQPFPQKPAPVEEAYPGLSAQGFEKVYDFLLTPRPDRKYTMSDLTYKANKQPSVTPEEFVAFTNRTLTVERKAHREVYWQYQRDLRAYNIQLRARERKGVGNFSRVVDVLLNLGLDALKEKAERELNQGSKKADAGQVSDKSSKSKSRRTTQARAAA